MARGGQGGWPVRVVRAGEGDAHAAGPPGGGPAARRRGAGSGGAEQQWLGERRPGEQRQQLAGRVGAVRGDAERGRGQRDQLVGGRVGVGAVQPQCRRVLPWEGQQPGLLAGPGALGELPGLAQRPDRRVEVGAGGEVREGVALDGLDDLGGGGDLGAVLDQEAPARPAGGAQLRARPVQDVDGERVRGEQRADRMAQCCGGGLAQRGLRVECGQDGAQGARRGWGSAESWRGPPLRARSACECGIPAWRGVSSVTGPGRVRLCMIAVPARSPPSTRGSRRSGPAGAQCEFYRTGAQGDLFITGGGAGQVGRSAEYPSVSLHCKPVQAFGYRSSRWA